MYAAKERGRDRAERFSRQLHDRAAEHLTLATEFRAALDRGELYVAYQPKIELKTMRLAGAEAGREEPRAARAVHLGFASRPKWAGESPFQVQ